MWKKFINEGFEPKILFKSSQWDFMSEMVAANLGITILPESICNRIDNENIRIINLIPSTPWHLAVITKKEKYVSFAVQTFIDFVLDFVQKNIPKKDDRYERNRETPFNRDGRKLYPTT